MDIVPAVHYISLFLVPPVLTNLSSLLSFHPVSDCVQFLVDVTSAKPPVEPAHILWTGSYQSDRSIVQFMDGVSNITICNLVTGDTGLVTMSVDHPAAPNISITFDLTVWSKFSVASLNRHSL